MKKENSNLGYINRRGSSLMIILMILAIVSILGISLITVATSNFKQTVVEREFQSVYYIAEAGVNYAINDIGKKVDELSEDELSHIVFFNALNNYLDTKIDSSTLNDFEEAFGDNPLAEITIESDGTETVDEGYYTEVINKYIITSIGNIGNRNRTVSTSIEIAHRIDKEIVSGHHPAFDYALYSASNKTFSNSGGSVISGSVYADDIEFKATGTTIDGSIISERSVNLISAVKVKGNIYAMNGVVNLSNSNVDVTGDIHATSNVSLSNGTILKGSIYTNGSFITNSSNSRVTGDIHAVGNVTLDHGVNVQNIYTKGSAELGSSNTVNGDIHSVGNVTLSSGANVKNIYTKGNIKFSSGNTIDGSIHAIGYVGSGDSGGNVKVNGNIFSGSNVITRANQSYNLMGNVDAAGNVDNGSNNNILGNVVSKKNINNEGTIKGSMIQNGNPIQPLHPISPIPPDFKEYKTINNEVSLHDFEIGIGNITADKNSTKHYILPGSYNNIMLKWNDTINFTGGNYYFNNIDAGFSAIKLQLDLSKGPINIYAKENIKFASGLEVSISQDGINYIKIKDLLNNDRDLAIELAGKVYWEAHDKFTLGGDYHFLGSILANNTLTTGSAVKLIGAYAVNKGTITMGYGPMIIYAPPTDSAAGGSGGSSGTNDEGQNSLPPKDRIKISPIREK